MEHILRLETQDAVGLRPYGLATAPTTVDNLVDTSPGRIENQDPSAFGPRL